VKKQIPKKRAPKRTQQQKPKGHQTQTQNVYINTHRQQRAQSGVRKSNHSTISTPIIVPFVQPLPPAHPFNSNAPQNQSGMSANVPVNPSVPQPSALAVQVGAAAAPPPQTPTTPPYTPMPLPSEKRERAVRGKRLEYDPDDEKPLPTIADSIKDKKLQGFTIETLKMMAKAEGFKIPRGNKNRLLSAIKKEYYKSNRNKT